MSRIIANENSKTIEDLLKKMYIGVGSIIVDYKDLYSNGELALLTSIKTIMKNQLNQLEEGTIDEEEINMVLSFEQVLKPFIFRTWNYEERKGAKYIAWQNSDYINEKKQIVLATFSKENQSVNQANYGIQYHVTLNGFLGANDKDVATLIEKHARASIYTIGTTTNGKVINSYNFATTLMTPRNIEKSDYEVILDRRYITPICLIYNDDANLEMLRRVSESYHIPLEEKEQYKIKEKIRIY